MGRKATGSIVLVPATATTPEHYKARITFADGSRPWVHLDPGLTEAEASAEAARLAERAKVEQWVSKRPVHAPRVLDLLADQADDVIRVGWFGDLSGVYVGWDGRLLKVGMAGGKGGLRSRLRGYRTHNPMFRVVGFEPVANPETLAEREQVVLRGLLDSAFAEEVSGPGLPEWFRPTPAAVTVAQKFHETMLGAFLRLRSEI